MNGSPTPSLVPPYAYWATSTGEVDSMQQKLSTSNSLKLPPLCNWNSLTDMLVLQFTIACSGIKNTNTFTRRSTLERWYEKFWTPCHSQKDLFNHVVTVVYISRSISTIRSTKHRQRFGAIVILIRVRSSSLSNWYVSILLLRKNWIWQQFHFHKPTTK